MAQPQQNYSDSARLAVRDYLIVGGGLIVIATIGWIYMAYMTWAMSHMSLVQMWMPPSYSQPWAVRDLLMLLVMWSVMMIAMMVPSAIPMVMVFTAVNRNKRQRNQAYVPTFIFTLGYLIAWIGFSLLASGAQWRLHTAGLLDPMMNSSSRLLGGIVLVLAGVYQWMPYKEACLRQCRTPLGFLMSEWREGRAGVLMMGVRHGLFCIGCCWAWMLVLFAVVWWFTSKPRPQLAPTGLFLLVYGCARFTVEWVRLPDANIGYLAGDWLTMGMLLTTPMIVIGAGLMIYAYRRNAATGNLGAVKA
jgi:predicted metal-binding membrane protein